MKYIIIFLLLITSLIADPKVKQLISPEESIQLLKSIKNEAIVLGTGEIEVHTFIDPLCSMSQRYVKLLYKQNNNLFSKYTIYLYLYEIKAKKSRQHILNIINAESSQKMLRSIMLGNKKYTLKNIRNRQTEESCEKVARVAKKIGVFKRPYIMIDGKAK